MHILRFIWTHSDGYGREKDVNVSIITSVGCSVCNKNKRETIKQKENQLHTSTPCVCEC